MRGGACLFAQTFTFKMYFRSQCEQYLIKYDAIYRERDVMRWYFSIWLIKWALNFAGLNHWTLNSFVSSENQKLLLIEWRGTLYDAARDDDCEYQHMPLTLAVSLPTHFPCRLNLSTCWCISIATCSNNMWRHNYQTVFVYRQTDKYEKKTLWK